jgi:hypothetical protein
MFEKYVRTGIDSKQTGKFKAHQYCHTTIAGSRWKSHIPEEQKKWQTANFCDLNGLSCGLTKMQNWRPRNTGGGGGGDPNK